MRSMYFWGKISGKMKVLFVCLGNICRSPMAEGLLRDKIQKLKLDWEVDSAGTGPWHVGEAPDSRAQVTMLEHGIDISGLRGRQFSAKDFDRYDLILTMDDSNYRDVLIMARNEQDRQKLRRVLEFYPGSSIEVPDPYWNSDGFEEVYRLLDEATERLIGQYRK